MSAGEAIALARLVEPDVAFIDLQLLDGPTGMFVAQHLRGTEKTLFVFITANATRLPSDYDGAAGVVSKPFSQAGITATIRYLTSCMRNPSPDLTAPPRAEDRARVRQLPGTRRSLHLTLAEGERRPRCISALSLDFRYRPMLLKLMSEKSPRLFTLPDRRGLAFKRRGVVGNR